MFRYLVDTALRSGHTINKFRSDFKLRRAKRIVIGAGGSNFAGWVSTDIRTLDVTCYADFARYWQPSSRQAFVAEHVWEHLTEEQAKVAARNCYEFLEPNGWLRIAVPDEFHPDPGYYELVRPGGSGPGAADHKVLYNYKTLSEVVSFVGYKVKRLEYWDEFANFHYVDWISKDGHIRRSKRFDPRNNDKSLTYTSLIVDAIKP